MVSQPDGTVIVVRNPLSSNPVMSSRPEPKVGGEDGDGEGSAEESDVR